jgi:hypothetical protein
MSQTNKAPNGGVVPFAALFSSPVPVIEVHRSQYDPKKQLCERDFSAEDSSTVHTNTTSTSGGSDSDSGLD